MSELSFKELACQAGWHGKRLERQPGWVLSRRQQAASRIILQRKIWKRDIATFCLFRSYLYACFHQRHCHTLPFTHELPFHPLCVCGVFMFSHVWILATLWTVARQALLSIGLPRQQYWNRLSFPPAGDLPDPGISCDSASHVDSLPLSHRGRHL